MAQAIDPHIVFENFKNPNIEDLQLFAELTVTRRSRLLQGDENGNDKTLTINFIGYNSDGKFTTNWTDNEETFGITSIDIRMTASYVPQVDIKFQDVRGQSLFFNEAESKYNAIFDMPPPIFDLTIKGYYGQRVTYRLHMIKQSSSFSEGSFFIDASFVGMTFAPLSDMFVDFIQVAPFLDGSELDNTNYLTLMTQSKLMVTEIKQKIAPSEAKIADSTKKLETLNLLKGDILDTLYNKITDFVRLKSSGTVNASEVIRFYKDKTHKSIGVKFYKQPIDGDNQRVKGNDYEMENDNNRLFNDLTTLFNNFTDQLNSLGLNKYYKQYTKSYENITDGEYTYQIQFIDVDNKTLATKINSEITTLEANILDLKSKMETDRTEVANAFGIKPTLDYILAAILKDAGIFFNKLKEVVVKAETERAGNESTANGEAPKYAFPDFYITKPNNGVMTKVKSLPKGGEFDSWPEVDFVNRYINAKMKVKSFIEVQNQAFSSIVNENEYKYVPINAMDSLFFSRENPFSKETTPENIILILVYRAVILEQLSVGSKLMSFPKMEANNLIMGLTNKQNLLNALILKTSKPDFIKTHQPYLDLASRVNNSSRNLTLDTVTYALKRNFVIKSDKDFDGTFSVPRVKKKSDVNEDLGDLGNYFFGLFGNDTICQYNIPFYPDKERFNEDTGEMLEFNNKSSYVVEEIVPKNAKTLNALETEKTLADVLNIFQGRIHSFFDLNSFFKPQFSGIYAVPSVVLLCWRNVTESRFNDYPSDVREALDDFTSKFLKEWGGVISDPNAIYKTKAKLIVNRDKDTAQYERLLEDNFIQALGEMQYIFVGDRNMFDGTILTEGKTLTIDTDKIEKYLTEVFTEIKNQKKITDKQLNEATKSYNAQVENADLKTQLYYTLKSFVDRWMINTPSNVNNMFTMDNFVRVDRGFNEIGDKVVMDFAPIYATETGADTSLYTLLLNILSKNNFEFFALPSFIDYKGSGILWGEGNIDKIFGTHQDSNTVAPPKFICMYVGGTSSVLNVKSASGFIDDSGTVEEIEGLDNVQAFKVDYGSGNQSFFHDIKLDQLEFKETSESIKLLDDIAKSGTNPTQTASNSLYNVYEQRSYTTTIEMMGNAMIQPTMYFQLNNIPMFKGTYLILEVSHHMSDNNMTTTFKGVRVPKVAKAYVEDPAITVKGVNTATSSGGNGTVNTYSGVDGIGWLGNLDTKELTDEEKAFADVIAFAEGTLNVKGSLNGYNVLYGGKLISDWTEDYKGPHSFTTAGRYQIQKTSWGENSSKPFNKVNQDLWLKNKITEEFRTRKINLKSATASNFKTFTDAVANTWASLPYYRSHGVTPMMTNWSEGQSFYGKGDLKTGVSQCPPSNTIAKLWEVYSNALNYYKKNTINLSALSTKQKQKIIELKPEVQSLFAELLLKIQTTTGWMVNIESGYRSVNRQIDLIKSGNDLAAEAGFSPHQYGLAIDISLTKNGKTISKSNSNRQEWINSGVVKVAEDLGFEWGGNYSPVDIVHFKLKTYKDTPIDTAVLRQRAIVMFGNDLTASNFDGRKVALLA